LWSQVRRALAASCRASAVLPSRKFTAASAPRVLDSTPREGFWARARSRHGRALPGGRFAHASARPISEVPPGTEPRRVSGLGEFDRGLGGGAVPGSAILLAGNPGIGKSTLLLQAGYALACAGFRTLYVTGEESLQQVRMRGERLRTMHEEMLVLAETDLESILQHVELLKPALVVVDSIQTTFDTRIESAPGAVSQVRNGAMRLIRAAKETGATMLLIGHVTKEGQIAGPRILEHMVDVVLELEGDRDFSYRITIRMFTKPNRGWIKNLLLIRRDINWKPKELFSSFFQVLLPTNQELISLQD